MNKILLGALIGLGIAGAGLVFAASSGYLGSNNIWNNSFVSPTSTKLNVAATAQVDSFVNGGQTCYILENKNSYISSTGIISNTPVGISCVKN